MFGLLAVDRGGLTAAFEAARLGHHVTLFEQEEDTGGNVRYAAKAPHKAVYGKYIRPSLANCKRKAWISKRIRKLPRP